MSMICTHVIFDMDGLILDTEPRYEKAISNVLAKFGHQYPFELKMKVMGRLGSEGAKIVIDELSLPITFEEYYEMLNAEYRKVFVEPVPLMPGAEKLIRHFHAKKVPIAVATSSAGFTFELKTKHYKELFSLFDHVLLAAEDPEVKRGKPDPQTFLVCASKFKNPPKNMSHVLVFEDSVMGIQAANAAGMISVWVPDPRVDKNSAKPALLLNSLEEFKPETFGLPPFDN